jgi:hypothetical protein
VAAALDTLASTRSSAGSITSIGSSVAWRQVPPMYSESSTDGGAIVIGVCPFSLAG